LSLSPRSLFTPGNGTPPRAADEGSRPIKIAIVDDSVVIRGLMARWFAEEPGLQVVGTYRTGVDAIAGVARSEPDVLILDIEMPDMDGVTALPLLLKLRPGLTVIMASTLTIRSAEISLKCLALGATDYLAKPTTHREVSTSSEFRTTLVSKVKTLAPQRRKGLIRPGNVVENGNVVPLRSDPVAAAGASLRTRPMSDVKPRAVLIGASTGGPQSIMAMTDALKPVLERVPILVTQHMPATFTTMFAEHLRKRSGLDVVEAIDNEPLRAGRMYVAPGGRHMIVEPYGKDGRIRLNDDAPVNFCKPSVDMLYQTAAQVFGGAVVAVTLTGMGTDGARGASILAEKGATIIAQDAATSVVWGMPGAVARSGMCNAVLPIEGIAPALQTMICGARK
jgi:two-component system, chemotaxis family, protein-glutamate methylesterase/glutaminase